MDGAIRSVSFFVSCFWVLISTQKGERPCPIPYLLSKLNAPRSCARSAHSAHTREAKLGCVFTQTITDDQGRPMRDDGSTAYTGAIETAAEFSRRIYTEAQQHGWGRAQVKVAVGDGADWIWNTACSGRSEERTPSLRSVAAATAASLTTTGSTVAADCLPTLCRTPPGTTALRSVFVI